MLQEGQEHRFFCRFCNKGFVSGNCLGGHMRGHLDLISAEKCGENYGGGSGSEEEELSAEIKDSLSSEMDVEATYGLRENPKKSWRCWDSDTIHVCKKCGGEFSSSKSLAVHMRSHSTGRREEETATCKECGKIFGSLKALFGHMRCHPKQSRVSNQLPLELVSTIRKKKRSRTCYSKTIPILSEACSDMNASSSIAGTEIDEVKEAATTLMIMSRDYEGWKVVEINGLDLERLNQSKTSKLVDQVFELMGKTCDGYIPSASDDVVLKDSERIGEFKCKTCDKVFHSVQALRGHQHMHRTSDGCTELKVERCREITQTNFLLAPVVDSQLECAKNSLEKGTGVEVRSCDMKKSNCYQCLTCSKVFKSGQALGGHKRAHYSGPNVSKVEETVLMDSAFPDRVEIPEILEQIACQ